MQRRITALSITSLSLALPPNVHSPYYYDIVGNVSTSRFRPSTPTAVTGKLPSQRKGASYSLLELIPRYPLMGGWNYTFTIGYDAPLGDYLKQKRSGEYSLKVPFLTPVKDVSVEKARVEIRLPEGAG
jgi:oligosaccharyltransferase complex subunit alpha (ribophorin I)